MSNEINLHFDSEIFVYVFIMSLVPIAIVFIGFVIFRLAYLRHQDVARQTIIAQYEAPDGLTPAEVGYLYDYNIGERELRATLLDLKQRGITADQAGENEPNTQRLLPHEIYALKTQQSAHIAVTPLADNVMQVSFPLLDFRASVRTSLVQKGYLHSSRIAGWLKRIALVFLALSPLPLLLFAGFIVYLILRVQAVDAQTLLFFIGGSAFIGIFLLLILSPVYLATAAVLVYLYTRLVGQRWIGTAKLRQKWGELEGFKLFIKQTELQRLKLDARDGEEDNRFLPYAIALKLR